MIRLSKLADYALVLLTLIAREESGSMHTARELAEASHLPLPTVTKLLKLLLQRGLLTSHRGIRGGYCLTKKPEQISLTEVISLMEGEIAITACGDKTMTSLCDLEPYCPTKANHQIISRAIKETLNRVTLNDLKRPLKLASIRDGRGNQLLSSTPLSEKVH
jgi:FeS assembly SUF system regulator